MSNVIDTALESRLTVALQSGAQAPRPLCDLLLPRLALGVSPEDPVVSPELLHAVASGCEAAGEAAADQPLERAIALLARAAALLLVDRPDAVQTAERSLAQALALLYAHAAPDGIRRDASLLLGDLMVRVVRLVNAAERDGFIDRGLAVARSAEYLSAHAEDPAARARALSTQALLEAERFGRRRDVHLMNALDSAASALARLGEADVRGAVRWPMLMLDMGNAALNIETSRPQWVHEARRHYTLGRSVVDGRRWPQLAAVFDRNLAMWDGEGRAALEAALPPAEQRARAAHGAAGPPPT